MSELVNMAVHYCNSLATTIEKIRAVRSSATLIPLICVPSRGSVAGIEWGNRGSAAGDIENLASKLYCRRVNRDFACRDPSDRGIAAERCNAECESC